MVRSLLHVASPGGRSGRLSVLVLHRVVPAADAIFPEAMDVARFDALCRWLKSLFSVLPLDQAAARLKAGTLPARALSITFDDGYADNQAVALPILKRHGLTATFFVSTGFLDGGRMWNDTITEAFCRSAAPALDLRDLFDDPAALYPLATPEQRRHGLETVIPRAKYLPVAERLALVGRIAERSGAAMPEDLMMTRAQVVALRRAGMQIGAHTVSHPILARLGEAEARAEIQDSKRFLEDLLDERVGLFAYPNGKPAEDFTPESVAIARSAGFDAAVSTAWGAANARTDLFQLPRFTPWDRTRVRFGARMLGNLWKSRTAHPQLATE